MVVFSLTIKLMIVLLLRPRSLCSSWIESSTIPLLQMILSSNRYALKKSSDTVFNPDSWTLTACFKRSRNGLLYRCHSQCSYVCSTICKSMGHRHRPRRKGERSGNMPMAHIASSPWVWRRHACAPPSRAAGGPQSST